MFSGIGGFEKGIEQAWNVLNAEKLGKYTKGAEIAKTVRSHITETGVQRIENTPTSTQETADGNAGGESWRHTVASVSAVKNQPLSSSQSTILITTGQKKDAELGAVESTTKLSHWDSQTNTNSSVITATLQKDSTENAPICVGYSEIDRYAIKVYERNFSGHKNYGDATAIKADELPDFDLLVGGFPCQAFSVAGKRLGFNETRGTLFFDIARILKDKRPRHLVLENVKGLLSHDSGKTFQTILKVLTDLGYRIEWQVLNSKDFGVPQNRERIYIVGHLGGECGREVFPIRQISEGLSKEDDASEVLSNRKTGNITYADKPLLQDVGKRPLYIRRLTPKECERLQGFPDDWTALGIGGEPISDTQRYKMCGNAVTVNVVEAVMERLMGCL